MEGKPLVGIPYGRIPRINLWLEGRRKDTLYKPLVRRREEGDPVKTFGQKEGDLGWPLVGWKEEGDPASGWRIVRRRFPCRQINTRGFSRQAVGPELLLQPTIVPL